MKAKQALHHPTPRLAGLALSLSFAGMLMQASAQEAAPPAPDAVPPPQPVQEVTLIGEGRIVATSRGGVVLLPQAKFEGATLGEVIQYLSQRTGANVMVSPDVKDLPVPDVNVRNITGFGLLRAIADMGVPIQVNEMEPDTGEGEPVWVITLSTTVPEVQTNVTRIFSMRSLQGGDPFASTPPQEMTPELFLKLMKDASDAINTALQAREEATKGKVHYPILKIHEATRLMIVSGNQQEVDIAQQVICALGGMPIQ